MSFLTKGLLSIVVVALSSANEIALSQQNEPAQIPKPFLIVEGWFDRNYVSDLYAFGMDGKLIRRLTSDPLPTNQLAAINPGRGDPFFVANASALYSLTLRINYLHSLHSANARTVAVSPDGNTAAFVIEIEAPAGSSSTTQRDRAAAAGNVRPRSPLAVRVVPVLAASNWRPTQFPLPEGIDPSEMTFTPDGEHVLITHWPASNVARILLFDLKTGTSQPVLAETGLSFYQPVFAPDGKSLLAVREDFAAGRWSIISLPWPATKEPTVVLSSPRGVPLSMPIFLADGKRFLFQQNNALARATLEGKEIEPLFGELEQQDRNWDLRGVFIDRSRPMRPGWLPRVVTRYFARVEWRERQNPTASASADLILIDVQTKQNKRIPMPSGELRVAVVVE